MSKTKAMSKCSCSLDLGIHLFPSSDDKDSDVLRTKFPDLTEFLTKKTEETYLCPNNSEFKLFPPAVLPDENLAHGFPSSSMEQSKENVKWSKKYEAVHSEQVVAHKFISFFSKNKTCEGFLFARDFHTDTYLESKKQEAKQQRKETARKEKCDMFSLPLSKLEHDIGDTLGLGITDIVQNSVSNLTEHEIDDNLENEAMAIKDEMERRKFRSWVQTNLKTKDHKKNYISYKHYQEGINARNFEIDMLLGLRDYQAIVEIEVKSTTDVKSVKNVLRKASGQLRKVNNTFVGFHKDILGQDWKFVRVIAMPNIDKTMIDKDTCCDHCMGFLLNTQEIEESQIWIQSLLDLLQFKSIPPDAYKKLFTRIVGFYSCSENHSVSVNLSLQDTRLEYEKSITGNTRGVASEETLMAESLPRNLDNLSLKDLKKSKKEGGSLPLSSAAVMIYWNPSQLSLLRERKETKKRVLFNSDFGCGKTMLEKNFAKILAEKERQNGHKRKVFFLSLAAAKGQELHEKDDKTRAPIQSYTQPSVIDVANQLDFAGKNVEVKIVKIC